MKRNWQQRNDGRKHNNGSVRHKVMLRASATVTRIIQLLSSGRSRTMVAVVISVAVVTVLVALSAGGDTKVYGESGSGGTTMTCYDWCDTSAGYGVSTFYIDRPDLLVNNPNPAGDNNICWYVDKTTGRTSNDCIASPDSSNKGSNSCWQMGQTCFGYTLKGVGATAQNANLADAENSCRAEGSNAITYAYVMSVHPGIPPVPWPFAAGKIDESPPAPSWGQTDQSNQGLAWFCNSVGSNAWSSAGNMHVDNHYIGDRDWSYLDRQGNPANGNTMVFSPGQTAVWSSQIWTNAAFPNHRENWFQWWTDKSGDWSGDIASGIVNDTGTNAGSGIGVYPPDANSGPTGFSYGISNSDAGKTLCNRLRWGWTDSNGNWANPDNYKACVLINYATVSHISTQVTATNKTSNAKTSTKSVDSNGTRSGSDEWVNAYPGDNVQWDYLTTNWDTRYPTAYDFRTGFHKTDWYPSGGSPGSDTYTQKYGQLGAGASTSWSDSFQIIPAWGGKNIDEYSSFQWDPHWAGSGYTGLTARAGFHVPYNYQIKTTGTGTLTTNTSGQSSCDDNHVTVGTNSSLSWTLSASTPVAGHAATNSRPVSWEVIDGAGNPVAVTATRGGTAVSSPMVFQPMDKITITLNLPVQSVAGNVLAYRLIVNDGASGPSSTSVVETDSDNVISSVSNTSSCAESAKSPSIQVDGADSRANRNFTGASGSHVATNGSWSQYGLLANSNINNFGSAGYIDNGDNNSCTLRFANVGNSGGSNCSRAFGSPGNFGNPFKRNLPMVIGSNSNSSDIFAGASPQSWDSNGGPLWSSSGCVTPHADLGYLQVPGVYRYSGGLQIAGGSTGCSGMFGTRTYTDQMHGNYIIYVNGDVNIADNINLEYGLSPGSKAYGSLSNIPQFTIYATGNININSNVARIDANLVSQTGTVNDCANGPAGSGVGADPSYRENGACGNQLVVNGAISTNTTPRLRRTYGAELATGQGQDACRGGVNMDYASPAECIRYTPNLYLVPAFTSQQDSAGNQNWQTTDETSLPVRY